MRDYRKLTREQLETRLNLAEDVCVMVGWTGMDAASQRGDAALELWMRWAAYPDVDISVKGNPDLARAEADLAFARSLARRDLTAR